METFLRRKSGESTDSLQSGGAVSIRHRVGSELGSKTSLTTLPSLPNNSIADVNKNEDFIGGNSSKSYVPATSENSFVEFDCSGTNDNTDTTGDYTISEKVISARDPMDQSVYDQVEVLSKDTKEPKNEEKEPDFFNLHSSDWKSMKTISELDYYNQKGELEFTSGNYFRKEDKNTSDGYTRIDTEEQVAKYAELDKKTDFLFQPRRELNKKGEIAAYQREDMDYNSYEEDSEYDDEDNLDSKETLSSTKAMLDENQKFAYVGIIKLITVEMATSMAKLKQSTSSKVAKTLSLSQKNFANWTMYINTKLYEHMDLSDEEKKMIENLSKHGLEVFDLTDSFKTVGGIDNNKNILSDSFFKDPNFDLKWVLICDLFLLLLSDGYYDSRSRSLLIQFASHIGVSQLEILQFERRLIDSLELDNQSKSIDNDDDKLNDRSFIERRIKQNKKKRMAYIGLATLGGSLAIGLSAGLLAPVIGAGLAAGLTTVGIAGTSGFLAGVGGSAVITTGGIFAGAKVGSKAGARRVGDVQTFEFRPLHNNKRTNLVITVSGWMNGQLDDVRLPFSTVDPVMGDMFSLLWEPEMLKSMGQTINILASEALSTSIQQILGATILTALMSAIQLPMAISKLSYILDNPWNVSLDRAWKAGKLLADTIMSGNMGVRPITLVGFSLGARLIYSCLIDLAKRGGYGLIENVIILGSPVTVNLDQVGLARSVVSGKFMNGYSKKDWILGYLFRATGGGISSVAGLSAIKAVGIDNIDCTELVEGHMAYRKAIPKILKAMNWEVLSEEFSEIEEPDPEQGEHTRKLISEFDEARAKMMKEAEMESGKKKTWKNWFKPKQKEWWDIYGETNKKEQVRNKENNNEEYFETEKSKDNQNVVFDLSALSQQVEDIQKYSKLDGNELNHIRHEVDASPPILKLNEEQENTG